MSPTYYQRQKTRRKTRSGKGVAARERDRLARMTDANNWRQIGMFLCVIEAHSDGLHLGVRVIGRDETRQVGTWRTCAATVARLFREAVERKEKKARKEQHHDRPFCRNPRS